MKWPALVLLIVVSRAAHADDPARAKAADRSARAHYAAHDYDAAIADYQAAYDAMPDPLFLFDIAQSYRRLHDCDHALAFYRDYLRQRPEADNHELVERFIIEMSDCATPEPAPATAPAPVALPPQQTRAASAPPFSNRTLRLAGITSAALGVVLIGTAVYFSSQAGDEAQQLETACARGCAGGSVVGIDRAGTVDDHDAIALYALGGAAVAAGVGAIVWSAVRAPGEAPVVTPTPGGATVSARIRF